MSSRETGRDDRLRVRILRHRSTRRDPKDVCIGNVIYDTLELRSVTPSPREIPALVQERQTFQVKRIKGKVESGCATPEDLEYLNRAIQVLRENPDNRA